MNPLSLQEELKRRPVIVCVAGSNGAGKSTYFELFLAQTGLRFVNADEIARELEIDAYTAADVAEHLREELVGGGESFVFETVFSDPVGAKVDFLSEVQSKGYATVLIFIGVNSPDVSRDRVELRVLRGGHDVPDDKLENRFPRTLENLKRAIRILPVVVIFDNSDLGRPYRLIAVYRDGKLEEAFHSIPAWLEDIVQPPAG